jgi:hypothetical protein
MKIINFVLLFSFLAFFQIRGYAQETTQNARYLISKPIIGAECSFKSEKEIYEATRLVLKLSKQAEAIEKYKLDSAVSARTKILTKVNLSDIANDFGAKYILFPRLNQIGNVLRAETVLVSTEDSTDISKGVGYATLNMRNIEDGEPVFIPSVISAFQRAFAGALKDTMLYDDYRNAYRVYPAKPLAICGIDFSGSKDTTSWQIITNKQTASYDIVEHIFNVVSLTPDFFTFDIETRDTIYQKFRLYEKMNFHAPSVDEIKALRLLEIQNIITGKLEQSSGEKPTLELILVDISDKETTRNLKSYKTEVPEDSPEGLRYSVKKATVRLLFGDETEIPEFVPAKIKVE